MSKPFIIGLVDDDEIYKFTVQKTLEIRNLAKKILPFSDGEEALKFLSDNINNVDELPDLIFLDINMPIMDGFQFMDEYVKFHPKISKKITIYMVTSSVDPVDYKKAKNYAEISDFIVKPIYPEELEAIINSIEDN
jgi:CheY-like chemotaxis protein